MVTIVFQGTVSKLLDQTPGGIEILRYVCKALTLKDVPISNDFGRRDICVMLVKLTKVEYVA